MLGSTISRLVVPPESIFTYEHEVECRFSAPANQVNIDGSVPSAIQHSFVASLQMESIDIDPTTFQIYKAPYLQYASASMARGSLSVSYLAKGSENVDHYKRVFEIPFIL